MDINQIATTLKRAQVIEKSFYCFNNSAFLNALDSYMLYIQLSEEWPNYYNITKEELIEDFKTLHVW